MSTQSEENQLNQLAIVRDFSYQLESIFFFYLSLINCITTFKPVFILTFCLYQFQALV